MFSQLGQQAMQQPVTEFDRDWMLTKAKEKQNLDPYAAEHEYIIGLDLGQATDHAAMTLLRRSHYFLPFVDRPWARCPITTRRYLGLDLRQWPLHTDYISGIAKSVKDTVDSRSELHGCSLVIDAGGNRPFIDYLRKLKPKCVIRPVQITGGTSVRQDPITGYYNVAKIILVNTLIVLFQQKRLTFIPGNPTVKLLIEELRNFKLKQSKATGNEEFEAKAGAWDDLVLSVSVAAWWGERGQKQANIWVG